MTIGLTGCATSPASAPETGFVQVADGVVLEYRDYGGEGDPIVLLTGLGNSAAVYDELAPLLTNEHRVVAVSRRGFGSSTVTSSGYDVDTRVADDLAVMDALDIEQAVIVGHSIAGDELTGIAQARPSLPTGLVYVDAALDRGHPAKAVADAVPQECSSSVPAPVDVAEVEPGGIVQVDGQPQIVTLAAAGAFQAASLGAPVPAEEVRRTWAQTPQGTFDIIDRQAAMGAINSGSERFRPDYRGIGVPVTALFADDADPAATFPTSALADQEVRTSLKECAERFSKAKAAMGMDQVREQLPEAVVEIVQGAPHYIFLQQPQLVAERILETADRATGSGK
jgi:pimeloyl-ACP methyl ester carboxylesterase